MSEPDGFVRAIELLDDDDPIQVMPPHLQGIPECEYSGCDPEDHEFEIVHGHVRRCAICGYFAQSLSDWWDQDLPERHR